MGLPFGIMKLWHSFHSCVHLLVKLLFFLIEWCMSQATLVLIVHEDGGTILAAMNFGRVMQCPEDIQQLFICYLCGVIFNVDAFSVVTPGDCHRRPSKCFQISSHILFCAIFNMLCFLCQNRKSCMWRVWQDFCNSLNTLHSIGFIGSGRGGRGLLPQLLCSEQHTLFLTLTLWKGIRNLKPSPHLQNLNPYGTVWQEGGGEGEEDCLSHQHTFQRHIVPSNVTTTTAKKLRYSQRRVGRGGRSSSGVADFGCQDAPLRAKAGIRAPESPGGKSGKLGHFRFTK